MSDETRATVDLPPFEEDARQVVLQIRAAFAAIVDALGRPAAGAGELQLKLGIDKTLAWRIATLVQIRDPFLAAQRVPRPTSIEKFLTRAARQNVPPNLIKEARTAAEGFERLIHVHAGDRTSLEMMLSGHAIEGREQADLAQRKAAFTAQSYIWGVQARTQVKTDILHPSGERGLMDIASIRGFVDLRWIRPGVPWVIARMRCTDDDGQMRRKFEREPIAGSYPTEDGRSVVPLLREFCSEPLPKFRRVGGSHGFLEDEIVEGPVGNTSAVTCMTGEVSCKITSYYRNEHNQSGIYVSRLRTPCTALLFDVLIHEELFGEVDPDVRVFGDLDVEAATTPMIHRSRHRLMTCATIEDLGTGLSGAYTQHAPRYDEMLRFCLDRLGWDSRRFKLFRVYIQYPAIPSSVFVRHDLPEDPLA